MKMDVTDTAMLAGISAASVSYTHLDVYKRQVLARATYLTVVL